MCKRCLEAIRECPEIIQIKKDLTYFPGEPNGFVYFFSKEDFSKIKIGYSKHSPYTRMEQYQQNENKVFYMMAIWPVLNKKTERKLHKYFADQRIEGEWFVYDWNVCSLLKSLWNQFCRGFSYDEIDELWGLK